VLDVSWVGSGGAAFLKGTDALARDPDLRLLHGAGSYSGRPLHISL
jgi:ABC-type antimicrobial peptide transport system permease subunit